LITYTNYETIIDAASGGFCRGEAKRYMRVEIWQRSGKRSIEISKR